MVNSLWFMVYGVWCMVYGVWCMVYSFGFGFGVRSLEIRAQGL